MERNNIAKTTKTKYAITNLMMKFKNKIWNNSWVREFEWGKNIWAEKNGKVFQNHLKSLTKSSLVHPYIISKFVLYS